MIADLHCHYPMHLLPGDRHPHGKAETWFRRLRDELEAEAEGLLAKVINNPGWGDGWRVSLDRLEQGGARIVCSVLYWPPAEFDFDRDYGASPEAGYFADLQHQMEYVEQDLHRQDPNGARHLLVRHADNLDGEGRVAFVHCVEGGFHVGPDEGAIDDNVRWLADRGVVYVTLAHLFFRGVATNAPAIPMLSESQYNRCFPQKAGMGLTPLGEAAVRAMYKHKVLVDISHMRQDAIDATFALLEELDGDADPRDFPVIASHVGMRDAGPGAQAYTSARRRSGRSRDAPASSG
jgi:microsomal dipeptidase-like Zn-dependent dipeptidase